MTTVFSEPTDLAIAITKESNGLPLMQCKTFGNSDCILEPLPAARMIDEMLLGEKTMKNTL